MDWFYMKGDEIIMAWACCECKEELYYRDEVIFLCGDNEVEDEEHSGSGDIDTIICTTCFHKI